MAFAPVALEYLNVRTWGDEPMQPFGWHDLALNLVRAREFKKGVEVGVWRGALSRGLIELVGIDHLFCVDAWEVRQTLTTGGPVIQGPGYSQDEMEESARTVKWWARQFPMKVKVLHMDSLKAAWYVPDGSQDFVILDASHDEASVRDDIEAWLPKVRVGGSLFGDDYGGMFPGVAKAVHERFGEDVHVIGPMWSVTVE